MTDIERLYNTWQSLQPLKAEDQLRLDRKFMLEFNYNSNHLEGNTLTYGQTELLLLFGKVVDAANMKDLEEMQAHNVCLKMIKEEALLKEKPLTETFIRQLHQSLLREDYIVYRINETTGVRTSYTVHAGKYKTRPNSVITSTGEIFEYASPEETPALMTDLVNWYNEMESNKTLSPIELAAVFHYRYIRIHPFEDGNGRISRLLVNFILLRNNYPMIVVKTKDKKQYLAVLNKCDINVGLTPSIGAKAEVSQISPFIEYLQGCLINALNICIKAGNGQSIEEPDDFEKELTILDKQISQREQANAQKIHKSLSTIWDVIEFAFLPIVEKFYEVDRSVSNWFSSNIHSSRVTASERITDTGYHINDTSFRGAEHLDYNFKRVVENAQALWWRTEFQFPTKKSLGDLQIQIVFKVTLCEDYYIFGEDKYRCNYGSYPSKAIIDELLQKYKSSILDKIKNRIAEIEK